MEFYISPEKTKETQNKLERLFKHFEHKPTIVFHNVEKCTKTVVDDYGREGSSERMCKIDAIKVEIGDVEVQDWSLVATVQFKEERILMFDPRYFKDIPEQYGLLYTKCDHCGSTHKNRTESHILYNKRTGEWMQVGSTCVNKLVNGGKYLNGLMIKFYETINHVGGCDGDGWRSGWMPSKKYMYEAIRFEDAMAYCLGYMEKFGKTWQKPVYDRFGYKVCDGTNTIIKEKMENGEVKPIFDRKLESVKAYFMSMERGIDDPFEGPNLTQKIIDAFNNGYVTISEMYVAWFAITSYESTLAKADFEETLAKLGIEPGKETNITAKSYSIKPTKVIEWMGAEADACEMSLIDEGTGIKFTKTISDEQVIEKHKAADGLYKFTATVKYIAYKKQIVGLGGRLKKQKAK